MKTKFALAFYYVAIGSLVITAGGIVWRLIIFPPCTPTGNTCTVDPGTVAGLAGTVLAVAATVLAILGAVAVAAWWTSLNDRVVDQVTKLYGSQKAEVDERVNLLLTQKQKEIDDRVSTIRTELVAVSTSLDELRDLVEQAYNRNGEAVKQFDHLLTKYEIIIQDAKQVKESLMSMTEPVSDLLERDELPALDEEKAVPEANPVTSG